MSFKKFVMAEYAIVKSLIASQKEEVKGEFYKWTCFCVPTEDDIELIHQFNKWGTEALWDQYYWPDEWANWFPAMRELIRLERMTVEMGRYAK